MIKPLALLNISDETEGRMVEETSGACVLQADRQPETLHGGVCVERRRLVRNAR